MRSSIPQSIIVDTGFWFALYDKGDHNHPRATQYVETVERSMVLIPWPCLYEVLNTRFVKNHVSINQFEIFLKRPNTQLIDDTPYKESVLAKTIESAIRRRPISLVDMVIRQILEDVNLRIDYLITFNEKDFGDICQKRKIQIFYGD